MRARAAWDKLLAMDSTPGNRQLSIVVVDDDAGMRLALQRLLSASGFRVQVFASAQALRDSGAVNGADFLVLDMRLPGESGADYYASLPSPKPPAVFITAHDEPASRRQAMQAGAYAFLVKPFDGAALLDSFASATWRNSA